MHKTVLFVSLVLFVFSGLCCLADCPSADLTGDCFVDLADLVEMTDLWLTGEHHIPEDMAYILGGEFEMGDSFAEGSNDEHPIHEVLLDSFYMSTFEITNQQYCDFLNSTYSASKIKVVGGRVFATSDNLFSYSYCTTSPISFYSQIEYSEGLFSVRTKGERDMSNNPMVEVSWHGAVAYCNWRSQQEGYESCYDLSTWECDFSKHGYRLPTEAEWEYAARGGLSDKRFPWGDTISHNQANYYANSFNFSYDLSLTDGFHPNWYDDIFPYTSVVGSFSPNGYGLYDMSGNVKEWCNDRYDMNYYDTSPYENPTGASEGMDRVFRGGDWNVNGYYCRVTQRGHAPSHPNIGIGFRLILAIEDKSGSSVCPSADLTDDCFVDFNDFAEMASQWAVGGLLLK